MSLINPPTYRKITNDYSVADGDVQIALDQAQRIADDVCERHFEQATHTETCYAYDNWWIYPRHTPIVSVTSIEGSTSDLPSGVRVFSAGVHSGGGWGLLAGPHGVTDIRAIPPHVTLTYVGGYKPIASTAVGFVPAVPGDVDYFPESLRRLLCTIARQILHPVALEGMPLRARSVSVGDVHVTGPIDPYETLSLADRALLKGYKKRQVVVF